jgi:hypothetical protein
MMTLSGEPNAAARELWSGKIARSFRQSDGRRRFMDVWANMTAIQTPAGERHKIFPASDPRFLRVLRKIVRGLHYHHRLLSPIPDELVGADVVRVPIPKDITDSMPRYDFGPDIFEYQFETFDRFAEIPMMSGWLLTFFENRTFAGWVWKDDESTHEN